ncbi:hypothetical protein AAE478_000015 [Parahypoxylon ruwenzoriense]
MLLSVAAPLLVAASLPLTTAQLNYYAKKAGLKYFGTATDSPGQRERAGLEEAYLQYDEIIRDTNEFGQTTATNGQKWLFTEPERGVFNFTEGDIVASIAAESALLLRCHTLLWHSQLAPWVEEAEWTAEELRVVITEHVTNVMEHYKGRCYAWDVVNEALNEDGAYRESVFYKVLGEDFLKLAFSVAAKIDPDAKLYYNDYNLESPGPKSEGALRIIKLLQAEGIKIDGVGIQAHLVAGMAPTLDQQIAAMESYAELGVEIALTELDVRVELPANETSLEWQAEVYKNSVGACARVPACVGVTIWDFYDPFSWVPYVFDGEGAALLWFDDFTKHPAYYSVIEALKNKTGDSISGDEEEVSGPGVLIWNYDPNNHGGVNGTMFFLYESNHDYVPYKYTTIPSWSCAFIAVCSTFRGRIVRGNMMNLDGQKHLLGTWAEVNWHANVTGSAWGDISILQGNDGAAVIQSLDEASRVKGFTSDLLFNAPAKAWAQKATGSWCLDKIVGRDANNATREWVEQFLDPRNVYIQNNIDAVINSDNGRFQITFYQGVI